MPYRYGYYFDPTYILVLIGVVISMIASARVKSTFQKYSRVRSRTNMTGAQAAQRVLNSAGIHDVTIRHVSGDLTDHYDPRNKTLNLSDPVYGSASVAAIGVAAHECGHAIQHQQGYSPLSLRSALVPVANFGSAISWPLIIAGVIFGGAGSTLCKIGILLFSAAVLFQLVTLPVEFNASSRALHALETGGFLDSQEIQGARKVLWAAAMTYVGALLTSILQLLRFVLIFLGNNQNNNRRGGGRS